MTEDYTGSTGNDIFQSTLAVRNFTANAGDVAVTGLAEIGGDYAGESGTQTPLEQVLP